MFSYHGPLNWPDVPIAIACAYVDRYENYGQQYARHWKRCLNIGATPVVPDAEVFEAAEATLKTFYTDEEWEGIDTGRPAVRFYFPGPLGLSWLWFYGERWNADFLQTWKDEHPGTWPDPGSFFSSQEYCTYTWIVWRMHLLNVMESGYESLEARWHKRHPLPVV